MFKYEGIQAWTKGTLPQYHCVTRLVFKKHLQLSSSTMQTRFRTKRACAKRTSSKIAFPKSESMEAYWWYESNQMWWTRNFTDTEELKSQKESEHETQSKSYTNARRIRLETKQIRSYQKRNQNGIGIANPKIWGKIARTELRNIKKYINQESRSIYILYYLLFLTGAPISHIHTIYYFLIFLVWDTPSRIKYKQQKVI